MSLEYVVFFKHSRQISEDQWEVYTPSMKVNNNTTIGDIRDWYIKHLNGTPEQREKFTMEGLHITQLT